MTDDDEPRWSEERLRELRRALDERRARIARVASVLAGVLGAVVAGGLLLRLSPEWWMPVVGLVALAGLVYRLVGWTCPSCGERLPTRGKSSVCPGCGLPLD